MNFEGLSSFLAGFVLSLAGLFLSVAFISSAIRERKAARPYWRYGWYFAGLAVAIEVAILGANSWTFPKYPLYLIFILEVLLAVKIVIVTGVGMVCCRALGLRGIRLATPARARLGIRRCLMPREKDFLLLVGTLAALLGYSVLLLWLVPHKVTLSQESLPSSPLAWILFGWGAAVGEEIVFRLGVQNYLARAFHLGKERYWIAIIGAAVLWTMAHTFMIEPNWLKWVQIFPLGLVQGWIFRKYGVEHAILFHGFFNTVVIGYASVSAS